MNQAEFPGDMDPEDFLFELTHTTGSEITQPPAFAKLIDARGREIPIGEDYATVFRFNNYHLGGVMLTWEDSDGNLARDYLFIQNPAVLARLEEQGFHTIEQNYPDAEQERAYAATDSDMFDWDIVDEEGDSTLLLHKMPFQTIDGKEYILTPENTEVYIDGDCPEISCLVHDIDGKQPKYYLFGRVEVMEGVLRYFQTKNYPSHEVAPGSEELRQIGLEYIDWHARGFSLDEHSRN